MEASYLTKDLKVISCGTITTEADIPTVLAAIKELQEIDAQLVRDQIERRLRRRLN